MIAASYAPYEPPTDLTGQTFGRFTVLSLLGRKHHKTYWLTRCTCGHEVARDHLELVSGRCPEHCIKCGPRFSKSAGDPTPEDIARETAAIRARWTEQERAKRCGEVSAAVEIQQVSPLPTRTEVTLI